ncbi:MAG: aminopeptidase N [Francisellaceae bacterium]|nr:aminopeptidase N [Francisellaceae bacterium]
MSKNNLETIYLKDYKEPSHEVKNINLEVSINDNFTKVTNTSTWSALTSTNVLTLHGEELELVSLKVNGNEYSQYTKNTATLEINGLDNDFELEIVTHIKPKENTSLMGLYASKSMYCTQCEAEGFRKITYYLDRPDVMSSFTTKIIACREKYPVLLSNGNLVDKGLLDNNLHYATWVDPHKKPSYLFAMVAGDLVSVEDNFLTVSNRLVTLKIFVERENLTKTAHALAALKKSMVWDEDKYDREYDLDIYMVVAVNDFNMGAMENKGLNIFNSKYVLADPQIATDKDYAHIDRVIGHEYFHNWSGNRVTCRDWFQLSLKEGFTVYREQQFVENITGSPVTRIEQVKLLRSRQFAEDSGPMAHPIRPSSFVEINNFYTMTVYEKGSEVIRMMATLLGPKVFKKACNEYFARFDGMAVTTDDFVTVMQEVSGIDLGQFKLWYSQAGTPVINITTKYDANSKEYTFNIEQIIPSTPDMHVKQPMHIPFAFGLLNSEGSDITETQMYNIKSATEVIKIENIAVKPVPSLLRNFSAPVIVNYDYSDSELLHLLEHDSDDFNRWDAGQSLYANIMQRALATPQDAKVIFENNELHIGIAKILENTSIHTSLKSQLLSIPSMDDLINRCNEIDPSLLMQLRHSFLNTIACKHKDALHSIYEGVDSAITRYSYNDVDAEQRCLKNTALSFLVCTGDTDYIELALSQYAKADNMTDQFGALVAINNVACEQRKTLLEEFYLRWAHEPLVVNKWLVLESCSELNSAFERVLEIKNSERFDISNPNMVYSLIGGFCSANHGQFHRDDAKPYQFLEETVIELDKMNPQVAARMLQPFTRYEKYNKSRQEQIVIHLRNLSKHKLSTDIGEIIAKSLKNA